MGGRTITIRIHILRLDGDTKVGQVKHWRLQLNSQLEMKRFVRAVERGRTEEAAALVENTPQLLQLSRPRSPLWVAARHGNAELAARLLQCGADPCCVGGVVA